MSVAARAMHESTIPTCFDLAKGGETRLWKGPKVARAEMGSILMVHAFCI